MFGGESFPVREPILLCPWHLPWCHWQLKNISEMNCFPYTSNGPNISQNRTGQVPSKLVSIFSLSSPVPLQTRLVPELSLSISSSQFMLQRPHRGQPLSIGTGIGWVLPWWPCPGPCSTTMEILVMVLRDHFLNIRPGTVPPFTPPPDLSIWLRWRTSS